VIFVFSRNAENALLLNFYCFARG